MQALGSAVSELQATLSALGGPPPAAAPLPPAASATAVVAPDRDTSTSTAPPPGDAAAEVAARAGLSNFVASLGAFCAGEGAAAAAELARRFGAAESARAALLRWLAADARAPPEATFRALHEALLAVRRAAREAKLRAGRARALAAAPRGDGLVDAVAGRFASAEPAKAAGATVADQSDRSAAMLRLLLRRASIAGTRPEGSLRRGEADNSDSDSGLDVDDDEGDW